MRPLWVCPRCGAKLVSRNLSHACGDHSIERFLEGKGPRACELYEGFASLVRSCGPVEVAPAKTRITFLVRVRFAGVSSLSDRGMTITFALRRPLHHPRIRKVEQISPRWYHHTMRITSLTELDEELGAWLRESYRVGKQEP